MEEESDEFEDKESFGSHLELYLRGMEQSGADTSAMRKFLTQLEAHTKSVPPASIPDDVCNLALSVGAPQAAAQHVRATMHLALNGSVWEVAAVFTFGREDAIPHMFKKMLVERQAGTYRKVNKSDDTGVDDVGTSIF